MAKVTIKEISEALGMSRNTVSKAFTDSSQVSIQTRDLVLKTAQEMNYRGFGINEILSPSKQAKGTIVFLTNAFSTKDLFWPRVISGIEELSSDEGYTFSIKMFRRDDMNNISIPLYFDKQEVKGIICTELYDERFIQQLVDTGIPLVMIDTVSTAFEQELKYDVVLMENMFSVHSLTAMLIKKGHRRIGFVGKPDYCRSFYERYLGFTFACSKFQIQMTEKYCLIPDIDNYSVDWIVDCLQRMVELPSALVCVNDSVAIKVMQAAEQMGLVLPSDLSITGFDDISEASFVKPALTTIDIQKEALGKRAAEILFWRIKNKARPFEITYLENVFKFRDSTALAT